MRKSTSAVLALILAIGSALRIYAIDRRSLWLDELASWHESSYDTIWEVIDRGVRFDFHPPGYQILLYFVEQHIGISEAALRGPSALIGILTIVALFGLGRWLYGEREGLIAAALSAVLFYPVFFSQTARPYALLLLLALIATGLWLLILERIGERRPPTWRLLGGYALVAVAFSYVHYFGTYVVLLHGLGAGLAALRRRCSLGRVVLLYLGILAAFAPWIPFMLVHLSRAAPWTPRYPHGPILGFFFYLFNSSAELGMIAFALWGSLAARTLWERRRGTPAPVRRIAGLSPGALLVLWLLVPFAGALLRSTLAEPVNSGRNLIIVAPAAYLLLARALARLPGGGVVAGSATVGLASLLLCHLLLIVDYYGPPVPDPPHVHTHYKQQFREAVWSVVEEIEQEEAPLVIGYSTDKAMFDYYFQRADSPLRIDILAGSCEDIDEVRGAIAASECRRVAFVYAHLSPRPEFLGFLANELVETDHRVFFRAEARFYDVPAHAPEAAGAGA